MLSYRVGAASTDAVAADLAQYYAGEQTMADYYGRTGELRPDLSAAMADRLGIERGQPVQSEQMANMMLGKRADGGEIEGRARRSANQDGTHQRAAFVDFTFSASKSLSVAVALAPDPEERSRLIGIHQAAVAGAMKHLERQIAHARRGRGGRLGSESGELGWISFDHFTARPTEAAPPDPQMHSHVLVPNVVLTGSGHVGSIDLNKLAGRVKEFGAVYQAYVAEGLRQAGASVRLGAGGEAELAAVPRKVTAAFSTRHDLSDAEARRIAARDGLDWDALSPEQQVVRRRAAMMATRQAKQAGEPAEAEWRQWAEALGYRHRSVLGGRPPPTAAPAARLDEAYEVAAPLLSREFQHNATLALGKVRELAARGLVAAGIDHAANDIDGVVQRFQTRGIRQDSRDTPVLIRGQSATTALSADQESEAIALAKAAAADQRPATDLQDAKAAYLAAHPAIDGQGDHWRQQMQMAERLAGGSRLALGVGAAGAGKSTVLGVLVPAWQAEGREVYGATLAWRQAGDLQSAGIGEGNRMALARFLRQAQRGELQLDRRSVVVVDEVGLIGTRQTLELLQLQAKHGFSVVGIGDPKQCAAVESGSGIELLRRALGDDMIPEITTSIRQRSQRDRETAALWRQGRAWEALGRLDHDGGLHMADGRAATIARAVELREPGTLFICPSNQDARDLGLAIRQRRQAAGELGPDLVTVTATDRAGTFALPLAIGDRVRLFDRVQTTTPERKRKVVAVNGDVCQVIAADAAGIDVVNERTKAAGRVQFDRIRDKETGAIRISTGEATTIHTSQGSTVDQAVFVLPAGSAGLDAGRSYTAASRHRDRIQIVVNAQAEREAIRAAKPLGSEREEISPAEVISRMADNLGRTGNRDLATDLMQRAERAAEAKAARERRPVTQEDRDRSRERATARAAASASRPQQDQQQARRLTQ